MHVQPRQRGAEHGSDDDSTARALRRIVRQLLSARRRNRHGTRNAKIANSGFGTVFGIVDGTPLPVCDHAGFAPFGFGYSRCPGEQLTINVFGDFLRKVWTDKIRFMTLGQPVPGQVPIGPNTVIEDDIGFTRSA